MLLSFLHSLVVLVFLFPMPGDMFPNSKHSNIDSIISLQKHNLGPEGKESQVRDEEYDFCITGMVQKTTVPNMIFGPFYKFVIEFTPTSLPCSPCRYSTRPNVTWMRLSFENDLAQLTTNAEFAIRNDDSLTLLKPKPSDFGTYYCIVEGYVGYIWSLEVEPFKYFDILKARHWEPRTASLSTSGLIVSTKWEPWSPCNSCDRVGKRHRLGYCYVEAAEPDMPKYQALEVYSKGLSCNLFLLIHPETDPGTIEALETKPVLLIGYCKIPCDYFDTPPEMLLARVHPKIQLVYAEQLEMRADLELEKLRERNKRKLRLVPGKPTIFEGLTVSLLILLQLYIIVHICRNRGKAK